MDYRILQSATLWGLSHLVKEYIADGWQPQGGASGYEHCFTQAVVKYDAIEVRTDWRAYLNALAEGFEVPTDASP